MKELINWLIALLMNLFTEVEVIDEQEDIQEEHGIKNILKNKRIISLLDNDYKPINKVNQAVTWKEFKTNNQIVNSYLNKVTTS